MRLATIAWLAFAAHAAAAVFSLLVLQHGSPVGPAPDARQPYVASHLAAWRAGWLCWTLSSLTLVALLFALERRAGWLAAAALPFDLPSQLLLALPAWEHERLAYIGTGVVANALYTAAFAWGALRLPRWLAAAAVPVVLAGAAVTLGSATMHTSLLWASMALLTAGMVAWLALLGVWASRGGR